MWFFFPHIQPSQPTVTLNHKQTDIQFHIHKLVCLDMFNCDFGQHSKEIYSIFIPKGCVETLREEEEGEGGGMGRTCPLKVSRILARERKKKKRKRERKQGQARCCSVRAGRGQTDRSPREHFADEEFKSSAGSLSRIRS